MNKRALVNIFIDKEKKRATAGKGAYLHFDNRLRLTPYIVKYITQPHNIVRHSFYPFIHSAIITKKYDRSSGKIEKKPRDIHYASHIDSLIFSWYTVLLSDPFEQLLTKQGITQNVIAYRKLKINNESASNIHFAQQVFDYIKNYGECVVFAFDITHFFDNLDHKILKNEWKELLGVAELPLDHYKVYRRLTAFSYVNRKSIIRKLHLRLSKNIVFLKRFCTVKEFDSKIRPLKKENTNNFGIPQGSPISALLSNIYLNKFDLEISEYIEKHSGLYRRYSDDIIVVCKQENKDEVFQIILDNLKKVRLDINPKKTEAVTFSNNGERLIIDTDPSKSNRNKLQYLGFEFDGANFYIRSSSISRYYRKMKHGVKRTFNRNIPKMQGKKRYLRSVYELYSHLGESNFIKYALRTSRITQSTYIKRQVKKHLPNIKKEVSKYDKST
jgi:hypothetical protein